MIYQLGSIIHPLNNWGLKSTCNFIDQAINNVITIALLLANVSTKVTKKLGIFLYQIEKRALNKRKIRFYYGEQNEMSVNSPVRP